MRADADSAVRYFGDALHHLDTCRQYDRFLESNAVMALGIIASERFDMAGWARVVERPQRVDWSVPGLARARYCLDLFGSVFAEAAGDLRGAMRAAVDAEMAAANVGQRAQAVLRRAEIARGSGDTTAQLAFTDEADMLVRRVPPAELKGDALYVPLTLAEEFALAGDRSKAEAALDLYRTIARPAGMLAVNSDVRHRGFERMAEGHVLAAQGADRAAVRAFVEAFEIFNGVGYRRRAAMAALRLAEMTPNKRYRRYALDVTGAFHFSFWMRRRAVLTPLARETVRLACEGLSNRQIAARQRRSFYTVRNQVSKLYEKLGIQSRRELYVLCDRLGILGEPGPPTH